MSNSQCKSCSTIRIRSSRSPVLLLQVLYSHIHLILFIFPSYLYCILFTLFQRRKLHLSHRVYSLLTVQGHISCILPIFFACLTARISLIFNSLLFIVCMGRDLLAYWLEAGLGYGSSKIESSVCRPLHFGGLMRLGLGVSDLGRPATQEGDCHHPARRIEGDEAMSQS